MYVFTTVSRLRLIYFDVRSRASAEFRDFYMRVNISERPWSARIVFFAGRDGYVYVCMGVC